jgi:hypothetical protein
LVVESHQPPPLRFFSKQQADDQVVVEPSGHPPLEFPKIKGLGRCGYCAAPKPILCTLGMALAFGLCPSWGICCPEPKHAYIDCEEFEEEGSYFLYLLLDP